MANQGILQEERGRERTEKKREREANDSVFSGRTLHRGCRAEAQGDGQQPIHAFPEKERGEAIDTDDAHKHSTSGVHSCERGRRGVERSARTPIGRETEKTTEVQHIPRASRDAKSDLSRMACAIPFPLPVLLVTDAATVQHLLVDAQLAKKTVIWPCRRPRKAHQGKCIIACDALEMH